MNEIDQPQACMLLSKHLKVENVQEGAISIEIFLIAFMDGETPQTALSRVKNSKAEDRELKIKLNCVRALIKEAEANPYVTAESLLIEIKGVLK